MIPEGPTSALGGGGGGGSGLFFLNDIDRVIFIGERLLLLSKTLATSVSLPRSPLQDMEDNIFSVSRSVC